METWNIVATLITGMLLGFFVFCCTVWLFVKSDDWARQKRKTTQQSYEDHVADALNIIAPN